MDMNDKAKNIADYKILKKAATSAMDNLIMVDCKRVGEMLKCHVDCKYEIFITPIGEKGEE